MTQNQIILKVLETLGGLATIKEITKEAINNTDFLKVCKSKTPEANIRRILQTCKGVYKWRPGLYGNSPDEYNTDKK